METRCDLVERFWRGAIVDVGIGSGAFLSERLKCGHRKDKGYDINVVGYHWLCKHGYWFNPYVASVDVATLWDVLEHIEDFGPLLANVRQWVFLAVPIFRDQEHALRSKHFRPDEHCWYFTAPGLQHVMGLHGFELKHSDDRESRRGREDILSFVFRRR